MNKKIRWITETAVMLALLICLQWVGSFIPTPMTKQLVTGSFVNCVLAVTVLVAGLSNGITLALISPVMAYMVGIAPNVLTVPAIMSGNTVFVVLLYFLCSKNRNLLIQILAWVAAAVAKFAIMYAIVKWLICDLFAKDLLAAGTLKPPMLKALPATFSWPQLITAMIGGGVALVIRPILRKALRK